MADALRIGLVVGELSGDRLGAALIYAIRKRHPQAQFEGVAGPRMREAGCRVLADSERLAVMGLVEVLAHLPGLLRLRRKISRHFRRKPPDVFVGIDAPDFNLSLEKSLKRAGIPTVHWVCPSVWAWRQYRLDKIRHSVDLMLTLFPFEAKFLEQHGVCAQFVGHPLADEITANHSQQRVRERLGLEKNRPCIALLPGSRATEVKRLLPLFLEAAHLCRQLIAEVQFVLPAAPGLLALCKAWLDSVRHDELAVTLLEGQARDAMTAADAVLLASGTAALECMLLERPMVVAYRLHPLSYQLVSHLLRVPYVSLPNHLLGMMQVPEYLQADATPEKLA
ncbi:MAG: lipid-A-disaccharide synthase, partial [Pseudomonadota bacterium]|nr:lipid-A-disaccharide synthase [Pseudomonadota bacterium]